MKSGTWRRAWRAVARPVEAHVTVWPSHPCTRATGLYNRSPLADLYVFTILIEEGPQPDLRGAVASVAAAGGVWCGADRGVAVARFEADDPPAALTGALHALDAIDAAGDAVGRSRGALAFGDAIVVAASGDLDDVGPGVLLGETVDRARALVHKARPGELLLERSVKEALDADVIVARTVAAAGGRRAFGLDRRVAYRSSVMMPAIEVS